MSSLLRRLGVVDLVLITIGATIGSGIFRTPATVAAGAHAPGLIIGCWVVGGGLALIGAFIFAELASRRPLSGGLYAYIRDAYHPIASFTYGWTLMLFSEVGGVAASAVLFAGYLAPLTGLHVDPRLVAVTTLVLVAIINILGVRQGATWQNTIVVLKMSAIAGLIVAGFVARPGAAASMALPGFTSTMSLFGALGLAMLPVLFSYNGFQGASFITGETVDPQRTIPRGLIFGVLAIVAIYVLVNIGALRTLGPAGLAASTAPADDVMRAAFGDIGARIIAFAIALSTLGFMSTRMLVAPRIYFQMADDGYFFKSVAWVNPSTRTPAVAIALQALFGSVIAISGTFNQIITWITAPEWLWVAIAASTIFVYRARDKAEPPPLSRVPGHPVTTLLFLAVLLTIFIAEVSAKPRDALIGACVIASGPIFFLLWRWFQNRNDGQNDRGTADQHV